MILLLTFNTEEEKEKFSVIYKDYAEFMVRVARRILPVPADGEDVVQDAFLYIADNLEKINLSDRQKTRSYLALITEHKAIDHIRRSHPGLPLEERERELMSNVNWGEDETLSKALLDLPAEYREIILLRYYYGYSYHEISELNSQSYFSITGKARRAKQKLAQILTESE